MAVASATAGKIVKGIHRLVARKRFAADIIRQGTFPLRPGLWFLGASFSRRLGTSLPPPLDGVKRWYDFRSNSPMKYLVKAAGAILPPWITWSKARTETALAVDILLVSRAMVAVGFDLHARVVMRRLDRKVAEGMLLAVNHLRQTYPCPRLSIDTTGEFLLEDLIDGVAFRKADSRRQDICIAQMLARWASSAALPMPEDARMRWLDESLGLLRGLSGAPGSVSSGDIASLVQTSKTAWIHGDLSGENIVLTKDGYFAIDFDRVTIGPAFFDMVHLFLLEAREGSRQPSLLDDFFDGDYDRNLAAMGVPGEMTDSRRIALLVTTLGWKVSQATTTVARACEALSGALAWQAGRAQRLQRPQARKYRPELHHTGTRS